MRLATSTTGTLTDLTTDLVVANNHNKNSPNSVSLLLMPFALNFMMVNEFPSTACVEIDVGNGCGFGKVGVELQ